MDGYIYCFSNKTFPGLFKLGSTNVSPEELLIELNLESDSFSLELSKNVFDYKKRRILLLCCLHPMKRKDIMRLN